MIVKLDDATHDQLLAAVTRTLNGSGALAAGADNVEVIFGSSKGYALSVKIGIVDMNERLDNMEIMGEG